jgi:hypothetical protein
MISWLKGMFSKHTHRPILAISLKEKIGFCQTKHLKKNLKIKVFLHMAKKHKKYWSVS